MKCPPLHILFWRSVICHEVPSPSLFFLATEFFFMATVLQLKVTKRGLFEKVSLERCMYSLYRKLNYTVTPVFRFLLTEWTREHQDSTDCLHVDPMDKCEQNNVTSSVQPTTPTTNLPTGNSTTNSTSNGHR